MENTNPNNIARVQHVAKSSSDQLLKKFAEVGSEQKDKLSSNHHHLPLAKRMKTSLTITKRKSREGQRSSSSSNNSKSILSERRSLLLPMAAASSRKHVSLIQTIRATKIKKKTIITAIEKTWRRTVEGASRVLMEKQYNRHKRLISDANYY